MTTTQNNGPLSIDDLWDRLRYEGLGFRDGQLGADTAQAVQDFEALMVWCRDATGRPNDLQSDNASEEFWLTDAGIMQLLFDRLEIELKARAYPLTADYYRVIARLAMAVARQESALAETTLERLNVAAAQ